MYTIKEFCEDSELLDAFKVFAKNLYANDPFWSEGVDDIPEDFEKRFFLVLDGKRVVGRACGIINPGIKYLEARTGLVGCYECENDTEASACLLDAIAAYLRRHKCVFAIGPMDGTTWHKYRITVPSRVEPFFLDNYHKKWYYKHFKLFGFYVVAKYYSSKFERLDLSCDKVVNHEDYFRELGIGIRQLNLGDYMCELKRIYSICIRSFRNNFLYTPISFEILCKLYSNVKGFIDPQLVWIAEDSRKEPVGFSFSVRNLFALPRKSLVVKTVAIHPDPAIKGLGTLLVEKAHEAAQQRAYDEVIHPLMHEKNISRHILSEGAKTVHTYVLFGKKL